MPAQHLRTTLLAEVAAKLETITIANGYTRNVARVFQTPPNAMNIGTPAIVITQGTESIQEFVGDRLERDLSVNLTFVDSYAGDDADGEALEFLADVQRAIGSMLTFTISATRKSGGSGTATVRITEEGSALNFGDPIRGKIYGVVTYSILYRTSATDPGLLP